MISPHERRLVTRALRLAANTCDPEVRHNIRGIVSVFCGYSELAEDDPTYVPKARELRKKLTALTRRCS